MNASLSKIISHWVYSITTRIKTEGRQLKIDIVKLIEYIPLQQGLRRHIPGILAASSAFLIEYIPLQQGLRPMMRCISLLKSCAHWVYSITTRIKTNFFCKVRSFSTSHWVYSITTRIKTCFYSPYLIFNLLIEYIPLQQGLRQNEYFWEKSGECSLSIFHYNKD